MPASPGPSRVETGKRAPGEPQPSPILSLVIPAYNEERRLNPTLEAATAYLERRGQPWELLVVDDGSRDATAEKVRVWAASHPQVRLLQNEVNRGKGYAVRRGLLAALGRYVGFTDADLSTPLENLERALPWLEAGYDVAIGSRFLPGSEITAGQPALRAASSRAIHFLIRKALGLEYKDTQCGFKLFRREAARAIFSLARVDGFLFDAEALCLARRLGLAVKEFPITWRNDPDTRVRFRKHALPILRELVDIRLRLGRS